MESLLIVVGSQSGNAAMVAQTLKNRLEQLGIGVDMLPEDCADPSTLVGRSWVLVCCSTHGAGDVPDNLVALMNELADQSVDLDGMAYGVIALGDRTYSDTFCGGGRRVDGLFSLLGRPARRFDAGNRCVHATLRRRGGPAVATGLAAGCQDPVPSLMQ
jgi:MioC protein